MQSAFGDPTGQLFIPWSIFHTPPPPAADLKEYTTTIGLGLLFCVSGVPSVFCNNPRPFRYEGVHPHHRSGPAALYLWGGHQKAGYVHCMDQLQSHRSGESGVVGGGGGCYWRVWWVAVVYGSFWCGKWLSQCVGVLVCGGGGS